MQSDSDNSPKYQFGGKLWLQALKDKFAAMVSETGQEDWKFSICEVYTNAPAELSQSGTIAWHITVQGKSVQMEETDLPTADMRVVADYATLLPYAKLIVTPENQAASIAIEGLEMTGNAEAIPEALLSIMPDSLHNYMASITA